MQDARALKGSRELQSDVMRLRDGTERTARRVALLAMRNWQKALGGLVALPAAAALSTGATMMFASVLLERAFEMLELGIVDAGKRLGDDFDADGEPRNQGWAREEQQAS